MSGTFNKAKFAGSHLLIELWSKIDHPLLTDDKACSTVLEEACRDAGATVLSSHFHHFGEGYGVTGVVILSESHLSIHSWPEIGYAAIDIFMCGSCNPEDALKRLEKEFEPKHMTTQLVYRGVHTSKVKRRRKSSKKD